MCVKAGVPLSAVAEKLDRRSLRVRRRKGDAKPKGHKHAPENLGKKKESS